MLHLTAGLPGECTTSTAHKHVMTFTAIKKNAMTVTLSFDETINGWVRKKMHYKYRFWNELHRSNLDHSLKKVLFLLT